MTTTLPWRGDMGKEGNDEDEGLFFCFELGMPTVGRSMILYDLIFIFLDEVCSCKSNGD